MWIMPLISSQIAKNRIYPSNGNIIYMVELVCSNQVVVFRSQMPKSYVQIRLVVDCNIESVQYRGIGFRRFRE